MYTIKCDCRSKTKGNFKATEIRPDKTCIYCDHAAVIEVVNRFNLTAYQSTKEDFLRDSEFSDISGSK